MSMWYQLFLFNTFVEISKILFSLCQCILMGVYWVHIYANDFSIRLQHNKMWNKVKGSEYFLNALNLHFTCLRVIITWTWFEKKNHEWMNQIELRPVPIHHVNWTHRTVISIETFQINCSNSKVWWYKYKLTINPSNGYRLEDRQ